MGFALTNLPSPTLPVIPASNSSRHSLGTHQLSRQMDGTGKKIAPSKVTQTQKDRILFNYLHIFAIK